MTTPPLKCDPWQKTVALLASPVADVVDRQASAKAWHGRSNTLVGCVEGLVIHVIERLTPGHLILAWHDPSSCAYRDQEWQLSRARRAGFCAVSGRAIRRGEHVYRPRPARPRPLNSRAMIHLLVFEDSDARVEAG
ncbi:DUF3331 domain-containing protein [Paraburkholderia tropica]|uniref:DUF3331 domain-containing protein n=1 Tax=Paraburkholderia tropica TaxID=92647 RepID=UPI0009F3560E